MRRGAGVILLLAACEPVQSPLQQSLESEGDHFQALLDASVPLSVGIELGPESRSALESAPREWTEASVVIGGVPHEARVRLKGHGSFEPIGLRPSFKVRLVDEYHGMETLILNNNHSDGSLVHERAASAAYRALGVPAARAGSVWVAIDGVDRGIYTVVEDVDPKMLHRWFADPDGSLYEMFDGDFAPGLTGGIEHEEGPFQDALIEHITDDLATGDIAGFDLASEHIDRDAFLSYWAVTAVVGQTDAYPYSDPGDDLYLYLNPETERFHFLPHGLDEAFLPRGRTIDLTNGVIARRCLTNPTCRADFVARVHEVFETLDAIGWDDDLRALVDASTIWREDPRFVPPFTPLLPGHEAELLDWLNVRREQLVDELP